MEPRDLQMGSRRSIGPVATRPPAPRSSSASRRPRSKGYPADTAESCRRTPIVRPGMCSCGWNESVLEWRWTPWVPRPRLRDIGSESWGSYGGSVPVPSHLSVSSSRGGRHICTARWCRAWRLRAPSVARMMWLNRRSSAGRFDQKRPSVANAGPMLAIFGPKLSSSAYLGRSRHILCDFRVNFDQIRESFATSSLIWRWLRIGLPIERCAAPLSPRLRDKQSSLDSVVAARWGGERRSVSPSRSCSWQRGASPAQPSTKTAHKRMLVKADTWAQAE